MNADKFDNQAEIKSTVQLKKENLKKNIQKNKHPGLKRKSIRKGIQKKQKLKKPWEKTQ